MYPSTPAHAVVLSCFCYIIYSLPPPANASLCITCSNSVTLLVQDDNSFCHSISSQGNWVSWVGLWCLLCVCMCVSEGNMPLSCAGPLADNGRVCGEHYQRDICSVCDNAFCREKVRLSLSLAHTDTFLSFPFLTICSGILLCKRFTAGSPLGHNPFIITYLCKNIRLKLCHCFCKWKEISRVNCRGCTLVLNSFFSSPFTLSVPLWPQEHMFLTTTSWWSRKPIG